MAATSFQGIAEGAMAHRTAAIVKHPHVAFTLSTDAVDELREQLGHSAETLIPQLQTLVREHLSPRAQSARDALLPHQSGDRVDIRKLIAALRVVIQRIDEASPFLRTHLKGQTLLELAQGGNEDEWERLRAFHQTAKARLRGLEARTRRLPKQRGRPKNVGRHWLSHDVAVVLRLGGVPVTTSRKGKFARVLETVLVEAHGSAPDDVFRLIKEVSRSVNEGTPEELRQIVKRAACYQSNPSFWRHLASVH